MNKVFTFWEGPMPAYIDMCLRTWKRPFTLLTYDNLHEYTDLQVEPLKRFTLPKVADAVRVHVLRDQGGYWLDADTIMLTDKLPCTNLIGYPEKRESTAGFLYADRPNLALFTEWAAYQDGVIADIDCSEHWSVLVNMFSDPYVKEHPEVTISPVRNCWPETYMIPGDAPRWSKYQQLYFDGYKSYHLEDLDPTDMIMLHNSWTPEWYKAMSADDTLAINYTLSNILREVLHEN